MTDPFMQEAIALAVENVKQGRGGPFAALVVEGEAVLARGANVVTTTHDPTAHAEVMAIRNACAVRGDFQLAGCTLYTTCAPCPMCLGAIYWARLDRVVYGCTHDDAATAGFDDAFIYKEIDCPPTERRIPMTSIMRNEAQRTFDAWRRYADRVEY